MKLKNRIPLLPLSIIALIVLLALTFSTGGASVSSDSIVYLPVTMAFPNLLYRDDFTNPKSGWPVDLDNAVRWSYQNDEYDILIFEKGRWVGASAPFGKLTVNSEYSVEAEMRRLAGTKSDYGIVFDWQDWDNFYYLIADAGTRWFGVAKVVKGKPSIVVPQTYTQVINPNQETNHLRVERKGDAIVVIINGKQLATANSSGFGINPKVGLYMESDADAPANVRYDNFEVWRLGNSAVQSVQTQQIDTPSVGGLNSYSGLQGMGVELFE